MAVYHKDIPLDRWDWTWIWSGYSIWPFWIAWQWDSTHEMHVFKEEFWHRHKISVVCQLVKQHIWHLRTAPDAQGDDKLFINVIQQINTPAGCTSNKYVATLLTLDSAAKTKAYNKPWIVDVHHVAPDR